jgi:ketosteroid isomerase-like protein
MRQLQPNTRAAVLASAVVAFGVATSILAKAAPASQNSGAHGPKNDPKALEAQDLRFAAMVAADIPRLAEMIDESAVYQHSTAAAETKQSFLDNIKTKTLQYHVLEPMERQVRVYGDVAIITGVLRIKATNRGEAMDTRLRFTDIYARRDARYRLVSWQSTRFPAEAGPGASE